MVKLACRHVIKSMGYLTGEKITKTTLQQTPLHARLSFKFTFSLSLVPALICSDDS
ncbi:hypothetical protein F2Q69_00003938 [Brassica cretica]|uniref:Uncharacterized protein n=1 Tax=Brassica cretica TaxID=69181 RepID=A0A8S9NV32_BRACR|nr:hypothetical protein F2Q69_00003938 [Brassica cretica]